MVVREQIDRIKKAAEAFVVDKMDKFQFPPFGNRAYRQGRLESTKPPYEREYSPYTLKQLAERQSLLNNAIEEKVNQAFRRGFSDWEKKFVAKCPVCKKEYQTIEPFREQLGEDAEDFTIEDIDFDAPRVCPNCGEVTEMVTPDPEGRQKGEQFFRRANMQNRATELLPDEMSSVSQTFLQVCKEVAFDIQIFDDGWMIFHRVYQTDSDGQVQDWSFEGVYRAPPYLMRYSVDGEGNKIGGEYYVCIECRQSSPDDYTPQQTPGRCEECGNRTYEAQAYLLDSVQGQPEQFFLDGEFAHDSEYRPTRLYGLSPIISLTEEAHTLQRMDEWHRMAYKKRRAPRGALTISSSNQQSVRAYNREQMEKLNADPQHIPVFMDDGESGSGQPISFQPLLESPTDMQNMQMREWFKDRISAKYGVTAVFQQGTADGTGMSQSLEIVVANRSSQRLQRVFQDTFIPAFIGQMQIDGWDKDLRPPEEEDESAEAQLIGRHLQNAQTAEALGLSFEWTRDSSLDIKPETIEAGSEEEGGEEGGLGGLFGAVGEAAPQPNERDGGEPVDEMESNPQSNPSERPTAEDGVDPSGTTTPAGGRPRDPNEMGGRPNEPDTPTTDEPYRRSNDTVTTGTSGYGHATFGGKPGEVIDILGDLEQDDELSTDEKLNKLGRHYKQCEELTDGALPSFERIEGSCRNSPNTDYRAFKRQQSGQWLRTFQAEDFVRQVYEGIDSILNNNTTRGE